MEWTQDEILNDGWHTYEIIIFFFHLHYSHEFADRETYYKMDDMMLLLKNRHLARNRMSLDYQYLLDRRQRNEEMRKKKEVSLSEQVRKKERDEVEEWRLNLENALRLSKGVAPLEKFSDITEEESVDSHGKKKTDDPLLDEAAEVLVDFVKLYEDNYSYRQ